MKKVKDNLSNLNINTDKNFEEACSILDTKYTHEEIINMLQKGNIAQKQYSALVLGTVNNTEELEILLNNLTGCDGKIREAISLKINKILSEEPSKRKMFADCCANVFADATIDINANICRVIIESAVILKEFSDFSHNYANIIAKYAFAALQELDKFIYKDKKYIINKQLFKLYWCLEALKYFYEYIPQNLLENIITASAKQSEYTVREKAAEIVLRSGRFPQIYNKLINDENYYVREVFKSS